MQMKEPLLGAARATADLAEVCCVVRSWGYFQRRMQLRREADDDGRGPVTTATESSEWRDNTKPHSSYGETSAVWR